MSQPLPAAACPLVLILCAASISAAAQPTFVTTFGGLDDETAEAVALDDAGNVYVAGSFERTVDFDPSDPEDASDTATALGTAPDGYLASYSPSGAFRWVVQFGGGGVERVNAVAVDGDRVVVAGQFASPAFDADPTAGTASLTRRGETDGFMAAYSLDGTYAWSFVVGGAELDVARTLAARNGSVYMGALTEGVIDIDPGAAELNVGTANRYGMTVASFSIVDGTLQWGWSTIAPIAQTGTFALAVDDDRVYTGGQFAGTVDFNPGSGVASHTSTPAGFPGGPQNDGFVAAYSRASGAFEWVSTQTGSSYELVRGLDSDGTNVYAGGTFAGTTDFDPGAGIAQRTTVAGDTFDPFVAAFNAASGALVWVNALASTVPGSGSEDGYDVAVVGSRVYAVGSIIGSVDFDPGAGLAERTAVGFQDAFIASYDKVNGSFADANMISGAANENARAIVISGSTIYVSGRYSTLNSVGRVDFDPGSGEELRGARGDFDGFVVAYPVPGGVATASAPNRGGVLLSASPNPSVSAARVTISAASHQSVSVALFDGRGRRIAALFDGTLRAGVDVTVPVPHWLVPGVYIVRAVTGDSSQTLPITILR